MSDEREWDEPVEPEPEPEPEDKGPDPGALAEQSGLEVDLWHGLPNYHCPDCGYAHLEADEVYEHYNRRHRGVNPKGGNR